MVRHPALRTVVAILVVVVLAGACGDDSGDDAATSTTETTDRPTTQTSTTSSSSTTGPAAGGELPGEPIDIFPYEGATLTVVGVAADDVLNVRSGPSVDLDVVHTMEPTHTGAVATGRNRQIDTGAIWAEITDAGTTGWANTAYLLQPGRVTDETAVMYPDVGKRPVAASMEELAATVSGEVSAEMSEVTIVDGPTVGDLGEVTVDVIGLADDSVGGLRLHLFAEPVDEGFALRTVEQTLLCSRGVTDDGLCL